MYGNLRYNSEDPHLQPIELTRATYNVAHDAVFSCKFTHRLRFTGNVFAAGNETLSEITLLGGLDEFQEHLGGKLTIPSISRIGETFDIFEIDTSQMLAAISYLKSFHEWGKNDYKTNS